MDFYRFIRRKSPDAEFDGSLGLSSDHHRPDPWWRGYHAMRAAARKFFTSFRRKRPIDIDEAFPVTMSVADLHRPLPDKVIHPSEIYRPWPTTSSTSVMIEAFRRSGSRSADEEFAERQLLWWNSLTPERQAKVHPSDRPRGDRKQAISWDEILQWWHGLSPEEQSRTKLSWLPTYVDRAPRPSRDPNDPEKSRIAGQHREH